MRGYREAAPTPTARMDGTRDLLQPVQPGFVWVRYQQVVILGMFFKPFGDVEGWVGAVGVDHDHFRIEMVRGLCACQHVEEPFYYDDRFGVGLDPPGTQRYQSISPSTVILSDLEGTCLRWQDIIGQVADVQDCGLDGRVGIDDTARPKPTVVVGMHQCGMYGRFLYGFGYIVDFSAVA